MQPFQLGYRPGLDGLRGLAIVAVLLDHFWVLGDGFGFIAVNTFFVLSGFLITSLLTSEWKETGTINFPRFYLRRALRLLPALVAMLIAFTIYVFLTTSGKKLTESIHEVLWALFGFTNWAKVFQLGPTLQLAHLWSLSIEEQFYLCWPWLLLLLLRKNTFSSPIRWLVLGISLAVSIRIFTLFGTDVAHNSPDRLAASLDTRADSLLMGCLTSFLITSNVLLNNRPLIRALPMLSLVSLAGLILLSNAKPSLPWMVYGGWLMASIFAAIIILQLVLKNVGLMHRLLENTLLVYVGRISYGLYIWHFPILQATQRYHLPGPPLLYLLPIFIVAMISYYLIEAPFLALKTRFKGAR